ncbi:UvrD-helicase domain-containing protein [Nocardioides speluncae]|uniref:UvrD-helicase domain-containing protein n=1 Tax=Nocardioides speluncae TaxID=2670337 RepID=UPI000D69D7CD|nr:UvrD-helicase domain-containing protein [Nocardioides speluncae]
MDTFDIRGPLPTGTTLLEASAGTGKTWTIGALVARYIAEGHARLEEMLVVTFGRAASQELRERVRAQLVEAARALADPSAYGEGKRTASDLIDLLLDGDEATLNARHRRIRDALTSFDAATIATTHQFCSLVLGSLGVAGDTDAQARLVEDLDDLLVEVVDDLYLRAFAYADGRPEFTRAQALAIARTAIGDPQARLEPAAEPPTTTPGRRVSFARAVRAEMERRKRRLGILSYDDLLSQLADALDHEDAPARARMRARWRIVLVDEFQDTDPVQWQVLDRAFTGHATMVLIGDPKQAIYAFRGGDVTTYLQAAATATTKQTLAVNWRADAPLLAASQVLFEGAALGDEAIVVHPVEAQHDAARLAGSPVNAPLRLRVVTREDFRRKGNAPLLVGQTRPKIAQDLALDIARLLASDATYDGRPLERRDIAVIAYRHLDLAAAREALHELGIPAVIAGGGSVFATPAAGEWVTLLEALEQPHRSARVRAAALTSLIGYDARRLDEGGDELTDRVAQQLRIWADILARRGIAAVFEAVTAAGLPGRVLALVGGERQLTDLRHIAEVLHETALRERLGLVQLLTWLRAQATDGRAGRGAERTRRLDSDAAAVQLVTIHASKGLQYPVVYLPSAADRRLDDPRTPLFHDASGDRCVNVGGGGAGWSDAIGRALAEDAGEWLRLLYVAMTRAQSQVVTWWAPTRNTSSSPLHRMLLGRRPGMSVVPDETPLRPDDEAARIFAAWQGAGGPVVEEARPLAGLPEVAADPPPALELRRFTREIDLAWRRTSYSSLTAVETAPRADVVSEPEDAGKLDESEVSIRSQSDLLDHRPEAQVVSPMATLPVGATFGSLVHGVLEVADPSAHDLHAEFLRHIDEQVVRWPVELDREELADALVKVCDTPLGPLVDDITLRRLPRSERLCEMDFELPLAGGDLREYDADAVALGDLAPILRRHLAEGDPVRAFADALADPVLGEQPLRGYLTGSVDVVLRVGTGADARYLLADYKTNWLGALDDEAPLTAWDYRPEMLAGAMGHSDYPLQALLYSVALHRYLRWRLAGYDPERHLGGVLYLYLRGMCGAETPVVDGQPCGVFAWKAPVALVEELSALLDGVRPDGVVAR